MPDAPAVTVDAHTMAAMMNVLNLALPDVDDLVLEGEVRFGAALLAESGFDKAADALDAIFGKDVWITKPRHTAPSRCCGKT